MPSRPPSSHRGVCDWMEFESLRWQSTTVQPLLLDVDSAKPPPWTPITLWYLLQSPSVACCPTLAMLRAMRAAQPPQPHIWQGIGRPRGTSVQRDPDTVATSSLVLRTKHGVLEVHERTEVRAVKKNTSCSCPSQIAI